MILYNLFAKVYSTTSILLLLFVFKAGAQNDHLETKIYSDTLKTYVEVAGHVNSMERTPFWHQTNMFGIVPEKTNFLLSVRGGLENYWQLSEKNANNKPGWRIGVGVEAVGNVATKSQVLLPQANASLRFRDWELSVGRKKRWIGLADSTLGLGSYTWSTNAMPIPAVYFGTNKFVDIPFTKGYLAFTGSYSDGWFEKGRTYTSDLKLHQKSFFLRIGKPSTVLRLYGGFVHQVQWGGKSPFETVDGQMPNGFKNYFNVVLGKLRPQGENLPEFETTNRIGNHLGSVDLGLEIDTYGATFLMYRQSLVEDGSLFYLSNLMDGLNGFKIKRKNSFGADFEINEFLVEFFYSKSQGGDKFIVGDGKARGKDDYFNHVQVRDGWSYYNRTIGIPVISPTTETSWRWPNYFFTSNNRVSALHVGLKGTFLEHYRWATKLTYSHNLGTYNLHFGEGVKQFSGYLAIERGFGNGFIGQASVAFDSGNLYANSTGLQVGIRKVGLFQ